MTSARTDKSPELLRIGEVARRTGVTLRTVRYYQSLGLIQAATRTRGGLHLYRSEALDRIRFIRDLRSLNLSLAMIRRIFDRHQDARTGAEGARNLSAALARTLPEVEKTLRQYRELRRHMKQAMEILKTCARCTKRPRRDCSTCGHLTRRTRVPAYIRALAR